MMNQQPPMGGQQGPSKEELERIREQIAGSITGLQALQEQHEKAIEHLFTACRKTSPDNEYGIEFSDLANAIYHIAQALILQEQSALTGIYGSLDNQKKALTQVDAALEQASSNLVRAAFVPTLKRQ